MAELDTPARALCVHAVHSMQPLPNYFGFLLLCLKQLVEAFKGKVLTTNLRENAIPGNRTKLAGLGLLRLQYDLVVLKEVVKRKA